MLFYDDLPAISINDLLKAGAFNTHSGQPSSMSANLCCNDIIPPLIAININQPQPFIIISGVADGQITGHKINLISKPFNLNYGNIWYFICPATGIHCRKLFYYQGTFLHRKAITGTYSKIMISPNQRKILSRYNNILAMADLATKARAPYFRTCYAGKQTKIYKKIVSKINAGKNSSVTQ